MNCAETSPIEWEATVESIDYDGFGRCCVDGQSFSIPCVIAQEIVRFSPLAFPSTPSWGLIRELLSASPARVQPKCPLFGQCGGCQYQHMDYATQLELKREQIHRMISENFPGLDMAVAPTIASPLIYGYRRKLTPHYGRIRNGDEAIGFQRILHRKIVDVPSCPIATDEINDALPDLRKKLRSATTKRGGTTILRQGSEGVSNGYRDLLSETIGSLRFHFYSGDFFQNNTSILPIFLHHVIGRAAAKPARFLVDAYCGVGLFAIAGGKFFEKTCGIEINADAIHLARLNAKLNGLTNAEFLIGSAESIFDAVDFAADETTVLIDPPRTGCCPSFLRQLIQYHPRRIIYVSCGPQSQMRDLKHLLPAYQITEVQPFDFFPQTKHIENLIVLERN